MPSKTPSAPKKSKTSGSTTVQTRVGKNIKQVYILVLGSTGSGKSTFINLTSRSNLQVSDHLGSCTQEVEQSLNFEFEKHSVTLIDTPGFDDTDRSDAEVTKIIAAFLEAHYRKGYQLHGVLYLHRISDNRLGGVSKRSLRLFEKLCGDECLKNVVIVTNMWNKVTQAEGEMREKELKTDERFFKHAVAKKAKFERHDNTLESAQHLIRTMFSNSPTKLLVQKELVDQNKPFFNTSVGEEISRDLQDRIRKQQEEMGSLADELAEAKRDKDKKSIAELATEGTNIRNALARYQREVKTMMPDYQRRKQRAIKLLDRRSGGLEPEKARGGFFCIR